MFIQFTNIADRRAVVNLNLTHYLGDLYEVDAYTPIVLAFEAVVAELGQLSDRFMDDDYDRKYDALTVKALRDCVRAIKDI